MKKSNSMQELEALRAQLQQLERDHPGTLAASSQQVQDAGAGAGETTGEADEELTAWLQRLQGLEGEQLLQRIREGAGEWLGELDSDLHNVKPSTILALFGLGLLVGRLTK